MKNMFNKKGNLIFTLFLFSCIFICMSFVCADNMTDFDSHNLDQDYFNSSYGSFKDLNHEINGDLNKTEIILNEDYVNKDDGYHIVPSPTKGIFINRSVTIDGQGHIIDANRSSRIFHINANDVVLKNVVFKNSISTVGGAVYCNGTNITIINSTFLDNIIYDLDGAAINFKYDGKVINSTFINNYKYRVTGTSYAQSVEVPTRIELITYEINSENMYDIVSFEKNYNVTIINSNCIEDIITHGTIIFFNGNISLDYNSSDKHNLTNFTKPSKVVDNKVSSLIIAKNKVFKKKLKTKLYSVVLKSKKGKVLKNTLITLKIKGKLFQAKTNGKGKATFKITKFYKKGNFKAVIKFKGSKKYKSVSKKVNIKIK